MAPHVASAVTVEASPAYLEVARREVGPKYGSRPTQFVLGDFAVIAGTLPDAGVVTLDRVVCCYPDPEALLGAAAAKTRQVLAFTYPRDRWYVRTMFAFGNFWLRLTGKKFRAFVYGPEQMAAVLEAAGLVRATQRKTLVWMFDLYHFLFATYHAPNLFILPRPRENPLMFYFGDDSSCSSCGTNQQDVFLLCDSWSLSRSYRS